jgi:hypothetical protein
MADDSPTIRVPTPASPPAEPVPEPSEAPGPPPDRPPRGPRRGVPLWLGVLVIVLGAIVGGSLMQLRLAPTDATPSPSVADVPSPTSTAAVSPASPSVSPTPTLPPPPSPRPEGDFLLMSRADFMALPTDGEAWVSLVAWADEPAGEPDLRDQDRRHGVLTLASALVFARTGDPAYGERATRQIMEAIGTEREGASNSILALGRQLGAYVLAADFVGLSGDDDERFREWLAAIRTRELGGHGRWTSLVGTHQDAPNNWGSFTGASRIAASLYLGDTQDVQRAAQVLRGFLGERSAWDRFQPVEGASSWACDPAHYTPVNPPCAKGGIDLDGAIVRDIDRGGNRKWPPGRDGIGYTLESLQGLSLQAELLTVNGYGDVWSWSDSALRRAAGVVTRSGDAGGLTWNRSSVSYHVPWLLNARYGLDLPTEPAGIGRVFGYTDWLYGG